MSKTPSRRGRRRKAKGGSLFGRGLDRRRSARAAAVCAALAAVFAVVAALPRETGVPPRLELWIPAAAIGTLALLFGATALLLSLPPARRAAGQVLLALLVAGGLVAVMALPAQGFAPLAVLSSDQWPLAIALCILTVPVAYFGLHRDLPVRAFLVMAAIAFVMILPDYLGLYLEMTGGTTFRFGVATPNSVFVYDTAEGAASARASGLFLTWYLLLLPAVWLPLAVALWRRRRP